MEENRLTNIAFTYANDVLCDGAGAQLQRLYGVYALSKHFNVPYYHSPLKEIGYQGMTALEKNENSVGLLERYNQLCYLPSDVTLPSKWINATCKRCDGSLLTGLMQKAREEKNKFFLVRMASTTPFTDDNPRVFECVRALPPFQKKSSSIFRIAIHVRWGDLPIGHAERLLPNSYYIKVVAKAIEVLATFNIPFICELHTEMPTTSFVVTPQHHGVKNRIEEYRLKKSVVLTPEQYQLSDFEIIPHLKKCINEDPIETLEALSTADLLIMSKSSFSYLAALFNREGKSLYAPFWHPPMADWLRPFPPVFFEEQLEEFCEEWLSAHKNG